MKRACFYGATFIILFFFGCQASFRISLDSLPKKIDVHGCRLKAPDGTTHRLSDIYPHHKATVMIFWQIGCPCVRRYQNRINKLYEGYKDKSVAFFHVSSNQESFEDVKAEYKKRAIPLPLLRDEGGILAKALGVKGTPSAAIINQSGEMVFLGWIDNERNGNETGRIAYLENALLDIIAHKPLSITTSPMFGCGIR